MRLSSPARASTTMSGASYGCRVRLAEDGAGGATRKARRRRSRRLDLLTGEICRARRRGLDRGPPRQANPRSVWCGGMPPPTIYVMSTEATGPRDDRRPVGVLHAAPDTHPPVHMTFCGRSEGLYWFGHVDVWTVASDSRCKACVTAISDRPPGDRGEPWTYASPTTDG